MDLTSSDLANGSTLPLGSDHASSFNTTQDTSYSRENISSSSGSSSSSSAKKQYCPDYLSIPDILSLSQRLPCTFLATLPNCGFIDASAEGDDIERGTKIELPLWLARDLHAGGYIEMAVPKGYNNTYREILEADANVVNLNKLGPNYYQFGTHLSLMQLDESQDIAKSLVETFHQRYHRLVNFSMSATQDTINEVISYENQLDIDEKRIFESARNSMQQFKDWENRSIEKVIANEMVTNLRKRKRAIFDGEQIITDNANHPN